MKPLVRLCLILGLFASSPIAEADEPPTIEKKAAAKLSELTKENSHGLAILVARDGKVLFQAAYGLADTAAKTPATTDSVFRIGSVTKHFTAVAILKLVEEGKLSLTDRLDKFFPKLPNAADITIRQLLNHTSGLRSFTDRPDFLKKVSEKTTAAALIRSMEKEKPDFPPGKGFHYNNTAYFVAGEIVAQISGKSFADYLQQVFFGPLEMKHTGIYNNDAPPANAAKGYSVVGDKLAAALEWDMSWAGGAGALYSTVGDLYLWNEALHRGRLLSEASYKALTTAHPLPEGASGFNYGLGLVVGDLDGLPMLGHGGGLNGWSSELDYLPSQNVTIVVLTNALPCRSGFEPGLVAKNVVRAVLEKEFNAIPKPKTDPTVDPKTYAACVGRYDFGTGVLAVSVTENRIHAQMTGQPKYEIFPKAAHEFFWKVVPASIRFIADRDGKVNAAEHTQNGQTVRVARIDDDEPELTDTELDALVGKYDFGSGSVLDVSRKGKQIFASLTGQPAYPIFPKSATEFRWRIVEARIEFIKDAKGNVTKAHQYQGGRKVEAPRLPKPDGP